MNTNPIDLVFDLETGDPDDAMTLALMATHPRVNLIGVSVFPGGRDQVGLVKRILDLVGKPHVPVGAGKPKKDVPRVSDFYRRWLGPIEDRDADLPAAELLSLPANEHAHLLTGAPLTNIDWGYDRYAFGETAREGSFFASWTVQGGFVGDNLMPSHLRLEKFTGRLTCPTFNLNGDPDAARVLLECRLNVRPEIPIRRMVPKSVCHGMFYTQEIDARIPRGVHAGLDLVKEGMQVYFAKYPEGKALHDLVAATMAIEPTAGTWIQACPFRAKGGWGCQLPSEVQTDPDRGEAVPIDVLIELPQESFERILVG